MKSPRKLDYRTTVYSNGPILDVPVVDDEIEYDIDEMAGVIRASRNKEF